MAIQKGGNGVGVGFLFESRRQKLQRLGLFFHSEFKSEHHIITTKEECSLYKKRLYGVLEKGFEINIHKQEKPTC